jgi:hypothetical protein
MPKADLLNSLSRHGSAPTKLKPKAAWRGAGQLRPGDRVITKDGRIGIVKATNTVPTLSTVHNFAVEDHHTYFVGKGPGVWVHNQYSGAAEEEMTQEEANNLMGPLEAKDAHLRPTEETNLRDSLSPAAQIVFDKHGEEGLRRVSDTLAAVTDDNPLVTEDLKGSRQNRLLEVAGYSDDEIRILRRGDDTFARAVIASDPTFKNVINFDTLGRLDVDGIREVLPLIDSIKASGPVDIFIGGAGDGSSNLVSNYETLFEGRNPGRSTFYFQQGNRKKSSL